MCHGFQIVTRVTRAFPEVLIESAHYRDRAFQVLGLTVPRQLEAYVDAGQQLQVRVYQDNGVQLDSGDLAEEAGARVKQSYVMAVLVAALRQVSPTYLFTWDFACGDQGAFELTATDRRPEGEAIVTVKLLRDLSLIMDFEGVLWEGWEDSGEYAKIIEAMQALGLWSDLVGVSEAFAAHQQQKHALRTGQVAQAGPQQCPYHAQHVRVTA